MNHYNKKGQLHNETGPAVTYKNGDKFWYYNGKLHRLNGPAVEYANGKKEFWEFGKLLKKEQSQREFTKSLIGNAINKATQFLPKGIQKWLSK